MMFSLSLLIHYQEYDQHQTFLYSISNAMNLVEVLACEQVLARTGRDKKKLAESQVTQRGMWLGLGHLSSYLSPPFLLCSHFLIT